MRARVLVASLTVLLGLATASWVIAQGIRLPQLSAGKPQPTVESIGNDVMPAITLAKTAGTDPNVCAPNNSIEVAPGAAVTYCYTVENTGSLTLTIHSLHDSALGTILDNSPLGLAPGAGTFLTQTAVLTTTTVNTATWTASNPGPTDIVTATAAASVIVRPPSIELVKTVGVDPTVCAATKAITVDAGADVTYCYKVSNTGPITLTHHGLVDSELGAVLSNYPLSLAPGASHFVTQTVALQSTSVNTATWTASIPATDYSVAATNTATVTVQAPAIDVTPPGVARIVMGGLRSAGNFTIRNQGTALLEWTSDIAPVKCEEPGFVAWSVALPVDGVTSPGASVVVEVTLDSAGLAPGTYSAVFCVRSNDLDNELVARPVTLDVLSPTILLPIIFRPPL